ncbi:NUDIX domain-containing protein [bacterium]|nr:NUDIX domain-containing protein [bacterium]MDA7923893.1 NUDIX domain-containing protein [Mariniblastus sp.]MDA7913284.1 NUDIX domain-containing protein [bacterium]MDA7925957.1 NUDIX domain-containing protein [Mariniblastus sp.]MDB4483658.1 NUDIX domain-containing protein [bacterium]
MAKVKSCGFLIYREDPSPSFLLMRHADRWDLPKGHVDDGETNLQCAYRELEEETGIRAEHVLMDEHFKFKNKYVVKYDENGGVIKKKKLIIYLAKLLEPVEIKPTEHEGFEWVSWTPPHQIQKKTIDPLLHHLAEHWNSIGDRVRGSV